MIKADELREFRPQIRYSDGANVTLEVVQQAIQDCADRNGIPVAFRRDQVKSGGMFNSTIDDCVVMYHPQHERDYFNFCIRVNRQGVYAFVSINDFGQSKQMKKANYAEAYKEDRKGQAMSYKIGSMLGQAVMTLGSNKQKLEEEQRYYDCIVAIFDEIVS